MVTLILDSGGNFREKYIEVWTLKVYCAKMEKAVADVTTDSYTVCLAMVK